MITYKESLTQVSPIKWTLRGKAQVYGGGVQLPNDSSMFLRVPLTQAYQKAISQYYKLRIEYIKPPSPMEVEASTIIDIKCLKEDDAGQIVTVAESCVLGTTLARCPDILEQVIQLPGGLADYVEVEIHSQALQQVPIITSVDLFPSYDMEQSTLEELDRLLPSFVHSENDQVLYINDVKPVDLVALDVDVSESTNLLAHFFMNFESRFDCTLTLQVILNDLEQKYSPIVVSVHQGHNMIGIPFSVRNLEKGSNALRIIATSQGGSVYVSPYKMQFSLDGRNLLSRTEAGNPFIRAQTHITINPPVLTPQDKTLVQVLEVNRMSITQRVRYSIPTRISRGSAQLSLSRQAEHITFDQNIYTQFEVPDCMNGIGSLGFKDTFEVVEDFTLVEQWPEGDCYSMVIDNTQIKEYQAIEINPQTVAIVEYDWLQRNPEITIADARYFVQDSTLTHPGSFTEEITPVQNLPEVTITPFKVQDAYGVIDKYC